MEDIAYIKIKILPSGLPNYKDKLNNNSIYEGFEIVENNFNENALNIDEKNNFLYTNAVLLSNIFKNENDDKIKFITLNTINYEIININGNIKNIENQKKFYHFCDKKVHLLEQKFNLETNMGIVFNMYIIEVYDKNYKFQYCLSDSTGSSSRYNLCEYGDDKLLLFTSRTHFKIDMNYFESLMSNNTRFSRAIQLFTNSFSINDAYLRFVAIFSSLEALLNIQESSKCIFNKSELSTNLAKYASKLLFLNKKLERKTYHKLKAFYDKRSRYIHGNVPNYISESNEFDLREIVRECLLIYWYISLLYNYNNSEQIIEFIVNNDLNTIPLDLKIQISSLQIINYDEYYNNIRKKLIHSHDVSLLNRTLFTSNNLHDKLLELKQ